MKNGSAVAAQGPRGPGEWGWRGPSLTRASAQLTEELPDIPDERARCLQGGEVAAQVEIGPVNDIVIALGEAPDGDIAGEYRHAGRHRGWLRQLAPGAGALVVHAGCGTCRAGQPVHGDVGQEEEVTVDGVLRQLRCWVGPFLEFLDDPGQLAGR